MDGKRPRYIDYALMASGVDPLDEELYLDTFRRRWGSLDQDALTRAVSEGNGEDKLFAIFGLGYQPSSTAHALLFEALESATLRERWAIALCLGNAGERRCLPMLNAMLTDHLPTRLEDFLADVKDGRDLTHGSRLELTHPRHHHLGQLSSAFERETVSPVEN